MTDNLPQLIKRLYLTTTALMVLVGLIFIGGVGFTVYDRHEDNLREARQRKTLCVEIEKLKDLRRADLQASIKDAEQFLNDNPKGFLGITPGLIQRGIDRNKMRLVSLRPVDCETFARRPVDTI